MFADVKSYVDGCATCESVKKPIGKLPMVMWTPVKFNQRVAIDPAGPFPVTKAWKSLHYYDGGVFLKWPCAVAVTLLTSVEVYHVFVEGYVYIFGPPEELISDRGANMILGLAKRKHLLGSMVQQVPCGTGGHGFNSHG